MQGSQTSLADTAIAPKFPCPAWCATDHAMLEQKWRSELRYFESSLSIELSAELLERTGKDDLDIHEGPDFGLIETWGRTGESPMAFVGGEQYTSGQLRKLAADCVAAAEWLEAQSAETMIVEGIEMTLTRQSAPPDHDGRCFVAARGLQASDDDEGPGVDIEVRAASLDVARSTLVAAISTARSELSS